MFLSQVEGAILNTIFFKSVPKGYMLQVRGAHSTLAHFPSVLSSLILEAMIQFISLDWAFYLVAILVNVVLLVIWKAKEIGNFKMENQNYVNLVLKFQKKILKIICCVAGIFFQELLGNKGG